MRDIYCGVAPTEGVLLCSMKAYASDPVLQIISRIIGEAAGLGSAAFSYLIWKQIAWMLQIFVNDWLPVIGNFGPFAILLSAGIAWKGISKAAETARKRATLDLIEKSESKDHYRHISSKFRDTFSTPLSEVRLNELVAAKTENDRKLMRAVLDFMNHYELIAIGIESQSLDEKTYKAWMMTTVIRDWNSAAPLVQQIRWKWDDQAKCWSYREKAFSNFQRIAQKWAREAELSIVQADEFSGQPPSSPRGVVDHALPSLTPECDG